MRHIVKLSLLLMGILMAGIIKAYPNYSPYAYAICNPVNYIDPDGCRPIYSTMGRLLGTDDNGLQGDAIIMDSQNFNQGMSEEDALKYDLGIGGLVIQMQCLVLLIVIMV